MALRELFRGPAPLFVSSPEACNRFGEDIDPARLESYRQFLEQARWTARVDANDDDKNLYIAERLAMTGMTDEDALTVVIRAVDLIHMRADSAA